MNRKYLAAGVLLILGAFHGWAEAKISLALPIACDFQFNQYLDSEKADTDTQKSVMTWNFFNLLDSKPRFLSGGDTGSISVHRHKTSDGVSIWLKQGNGAHLFTVWPDGVAFWSKHNDIFDRKATQQFRGSCENVRQTN